jgi:hypothetical protein
LKIWNEQVQELLTTFDDRKPPVVWTLEAGHVSSHLPRLLCWMMGKKYQNSAFFEIFESAKRVVHIFEIRRHCGRSYRFQVYASNAYDTVSSIPSNDPWNISLKKGNDDKVIHPGHNFEYEPRKELLHEHGLLFGMLTLLTDRSNMESQFESDTWSQDNIEVWRSRQTARKALSANRALDNVEFEEDVKEKLIPAIYLRSLLPDVLFDGYDFWKSGRNVIRGIAKPPDLSVVLQEVKGAATTESLSIPLKYRMPGSASSESDESGNPDGENVVDDTTNPSWWRGSELYIRLFRRGTGAVSAVVERLPQTFIEGDCADYDESEKMQDLRKKEEAAAQLIRRGLLLDASFAAPGSAIFEVRKMLEQLQPLCLMLFWTKAQPTDDELLENRQNLELRLPISFVEMPRLGLTFIVEQYGNDLTDLKVRIRSVERAGYYVKPIESFDLERRQQLWDIVEGLQEYLILEDKEGNLELLVCLRTDGNPRQSLKGSPYHCRFVPLYTNQGSYQTNRCYKYVAYGIHSSGAYLIMPSILGRLYMIYLRLLTYRYDEASALIDGLYIDSDKIKKSESDLIGFISDASNSRTADAVLCQLKFMWRCSDNNQLKGVYSSKISTIYALFVAVRELVSESLLPNGSTEESIAAKLVKKTSTSAEEPTSYRPDYRIGAILRNRARMSKDMIQYLQKVMKFRLKLTEVLQSEEEVDSNNRKLWKPAIKWPEAVTTDTTVSLEWDRSTEGFTAESESLNLTSESISLTANDIWARVAYYVFISNAPLRDPPPPVVTINEADDSRYCMLCFYLICF